MAIAAVLGVRLEIAPSVLSAVAAAAEHAYPREACGFLCGPPQPLAAVTHMRAVANIQDHLHAQDPEAYPRTARTAYAMPASELLGLDRPTAAPVKVIFHSHPDHDAYFSAHDREVAMAGGGTPAYPLQQLVVSVRAGRAVRALLFDFDPAACDFREVAEYHLQQG